MTLESDDERQWLRLRALRAERAQTALHHASREREAAAAALQRRLLRIEAGRRALRELDHARLHEWAAQMPRWAGLMGLRRDHLYEQIERDEYALHGERRTLTEADATLQRRRIDLTHALMRLQAAQTWLNEQGRVRATTQERRTERELDDVLARPGRLELWTAVETRHA